MSNEIWVVRHAQSVANRGDVSTTLHSDIPLSPDGANAAVAFADAFDRRPDLIIVSPYLRTRQTAAPFIAKYSDVPVEFWPIQEFNYLDNQKCLGTTIDERRAMRPPPCRSSRPAARKDLPSEASASPIRLPLSLLRLLERWNRRYGFAKHPLVLVVVVPGHRP